MISKQQFVEAINSIKKVDDFKTKYYDLLVIDNIPDCAQQLINLLIIDMNLLTNETIGDTISWWCYEVCYGDQANDYPITLEDGTKIQLHAAEELYDYLLEYESK